jgi:hypothetical protein
MTRFLMFTFFFTEKSLQSAIENKNVLFLIVKKVAAVALVMTMSSSCNVGVERHKRREISQDIGSENARSKSSTNGNEMQDFDADDHQEGGEQESSTLALNLTPETLLWKRYRAFEDGLSQGLQVDKNRLCLELGQHSCIDKVHLTVLGGNEPYTMGQYEAARSPTILTGVAVDRIVLAACEARLSLDRGLGAGAVIFKAFPLTASEVTPDQARNQTASLYQRLLARDATTDELNIAQDILKITKSPDKVALALCFTVGSQIENIFL